MTEKKEQVGVGKKSLSGLQNLQQGKNGGTGNSSDNGGGSSGNGGQNNR